MPKGKIGITMIQKVCPVCGSQFEAPQRKKQQKTCSIECGQKLRIAAVTGETHKGTSQVTCQHCNKEFKAFASQVKRGVKFCSKECSDSAMYIRVEKECEACKKPFMVAKFREGIARFCCNKCARSVLSIDRRDRVKIKCACCGVEFEEKKGRAERTKFCSKDCMWKVLKGSGSPHWAGVGVYEYYFDENGIEKKRKARDVGTAKTAKRNAGAKQATPGWADQTKIRAVYKAARLITEATGISHHVDHIIPLNGKTVSGLHNEFNLQVLTKTENLKKHNKHWPDKP